MLFFAAGCLLFGLVASVYALRMRNDNFSLRMNLYAERQDAKARPLYLPPPDLSGLTAEDFRRLKESYTTLGTAAQHTTYQMQEFSYQTDQHIIQEEP